jgi:hypothetical protein
MIASVNDRLLDHLSACEHKLRDALTSERPGFQAALDARDQARAAVLANMVPSDPATIYDAVDGEYSIAWADRNDEDQINLDPSHGVRRFIAMYEAGERFCVCLPDGYDEDGGWDGWHYEWFRTELAANAALAAATAHFPSTQEAEAPTSQQGGE